MVTVADFEPAGGGCTPKMGQETANPVGTEEGFMHSPGMGVGDGVGVGVGVTLGVGVGVGVAEGEAEGPELGEGVGVEMTSGVKEIVFTVCQSPFTPAPLSIKIWLPILVPLSLQVLL